MCLARITERPNPTNKIVTAFKIMKIETRLKYFHSVYGIWRGPNGYTDEVSSFPKMRWLKANKNYWSLEANDSFDSNYGYRHGFHCFETVEDAIAFARIMWDNLDEGEHFSYFVLPVELRQIHTIGTQATAKVLVADYMRITYSNLWKAKRLGGLLR